MGMAIRIILVYGDGNKDYTGLWGGQWGLYWFMGRAMGIILVYGDGNGDYTGLWGGQWGLYWFMGIVN